MTETVDIVVVGSTPMALLLAGLLADRHGRQVALVHDAEGVNRLPVGLDLSIAPMTRPQSWEMVSAGTRETLRALGKIADRGGLYQVDPVFVARSLPGKVAIAHFRQMASGYGHDVERPGSGPIKGSERLVVRDATVVRRDRLTPQIEAWLKGMPIALVAQRGCAIRWDGAGSVLVTSADRRIEAGLAVFADEAAILGFAQDQFSEALEPIRMTALLSQPKAGSPGVSYDLDTGASLLVSPSGTTQALCSGTEEQARGAIADLLGVETPLALSAQRNLQTLISKDGAGTVGRAVAKGPFLVAGLGVTGLFLTPALARVLAGAGSQAEDAYFAALAPGRDRSGLGDIGLAS